MNITASGQRKPLRILKLPSPRVIDTFRCQFQRNRVTFSTCPAIVCNNRTPMRGGTDGSGHDLSAAGQLRRNSRQYVSPALANGNYSLLVRLFRK